MSVLLNWSLMNRSGIKRIAAVRPRFPPPISRANQIPINRIKIKREDSKGYLALEIISTKRKLKKLKKNFEVYVLYDFLKHLLKKKRNYFDATFLVVIKGITHSMLVFMGNKFPLIKS